MTISTPPKPAAIAGCARLIPAVGEAALILPR
jgi:hypothetical protein